MSVIFVFAFKKAKNNGKVFKSGHSVGKKSTHRGRSEV